MTKQNAITRAQALEYAIAHCDNDAVIEVLRKMHAQVTKPRKKSDAPTKTQLVNANLCKAAIEAFKAHGNEGYDVKWISNHVNGILTSQKATAVMRFGMANGLIERNQDGKAITFRAIQPKDKKTADNRRSFL